MREASDRVEDDEGLSDEDLAKFREQIVEEYGPDGLGENTLEGQLYELALEERRSGDKPQTDKAKGPVAPEVTESSESEGASKSEGTADIDRVIFESAGPMVDHEKGESESADPELLVVQHDKGPTTERPDPDGISTTAENFNRNENQIVVTQQEQSPEGPGKAPSDSQLETSDLHRLPAESRVEPEAEEVRTLESVDYGRGAVLRVPNADLERVGYEHEAGRDSILELGLRKAGDEDVETVFARYVASSNRAEAYVGDIGGEKGSRYECVEAKEYSEDKFVKDFDRGKCEHLQNVGLEHVDGKMFVRVDDRKVELEDYRLATSGSHVVLRGRLDDSDCKIEFDGRRASVRFGRDYMVEGMRMEGDDLVVGYVQSRNERYEHRAYLAHLEEPEKPALGQFGKARCWNM